MIEFRGVHKWFGELHVLKGIQLKVAPAEVLVAGTLPVANLSLVWHSTPPEIWRSSSGSRSKRSWRS